MIWQVLYNGLLAASLYALVALGYTLIYGVARLINFSHGDVMMVSAYVAWLLADYSGWPLPIAAMGACAAGLAIATAIERVAVRPASRTRDPLAPVIATIGASVMLQAMIGLAFGAQARGLSPAASTEGVNIGPIRTTEAQLWTLAVSISAALALMLFLHRHRLGRAIRAVADDAALAQAVGIDPRRTIVAAFALSGVLAGLAGVALALDASLRPTMGYAIGFRGFTAAIVGGIGNPTGTLVGAALMGLVTSVSGTYLASEWTPAYVFGVLVVALLLKPQGLLPARQAVLAR